MDTQADCPLCRLKMSSLTHLRRHLGKHHEELSLFALPSHMKDDADDDADDSDGDDDVRSLSSVANSALSASSALVVCDECGLEFDGKHNGEKRDALEQHVQTVHQRNFDLEPVFDDYDPRISRAKELLRLQPTIVEATDDQMFDETLLDHQIRRHLPADIHTWANLKDWATQHTDLIEPSKATRFPILQAVQFGAALATQDIDEYYDDLIGCHAARGIHNSDKLKYVIDNRTVTFYQVLKAVHALGGPAELEKTQTWADAGFYLSHIKRLTPDAATSIRIIYDTFVTQFKDDLEQIKDLYPPAADGLVGTWPVMVSYPGSIAVREASLSVYSTYTAFSFTGSHEYWFMYHKHIDSLHIHKIIRISGKVTALPSPDSRGKNVFTTELTILPVNTVHYDAMAQCLRRISSPHNFDVDLGDQDEEDSEKNDFIIDEEEDREPFEQSRKVHNERKAKGSISNPPESGADEKSQLEPSVKPTIQVKVDGLTAYDRETWVTMTLHIFYFEISTDETTDDGHVPQEWTMWYESMEDIYLHPRRVQLKGWVDVRDESTSSSGLFKDLTLTFRTNEDAEDTANYLQERSSWSSKRKAREIEQQPALTSSATIRDRPRTTVDEYHSGDTDSHVIDGNTTGRPSPAAATVNTSSTDLSTEAESKAPVLVQQQSPPAPTLLELVAITDNHSFQAADIVAGHPVPEGYGRTFKVDGIPEIEQTVDAEVFVHRADLCIRPLSISTTTWVIPATPRMLIMKPPKLSLAVRIQTYIRALRDGSKGSQLANIDLIAYDTPDMDWLRSILQIMKTTSNNISTAFDEDDALDLQLGRSRSPIEPGTATNGLTYKVKWALANASQEGLKSQPFADATLVLGHTSVSFPQPMISFSYVDIVDARLESTYIVISTSALTLHIQAAIERDRHDIFQMIWRMRFPFSTLPDWADVLKTYDTSKSTPMGTEISNSLPSEQEALISYEQALSWLDSSEDFADDFVMTMYELKIADNPSSLGTVRKALSVIAEHRNSAWLRQFLKHGSVTDPELDRLVAADHRAANTDSAQGASIDAEISSGTALSTLGNTITSRSDPWWVPPNVDQEHLRCPHGCKDTFNGTRELLTHLSSTHETLGVPEGEESRLYPVTSQATNIMEELAASLSDSDALFQASLAQGEADRQASKMMALDAKRTALQDALVESSAYNVKRPSDAVVQALYHRRMRDMNLQPEDGTSINAKWKWLYSSGDPGLKDEVAKLQEVLKHSNAEVEAEVKSLDAPEGSGTSSRHGTRD
jgi:hypothetical protein